ncbi:uncharacterized protein DMENIID0001_026520 [Sergentomyia squamirostris]
MNNVPRLLIFPYITKLRLKSRSRTEEFSVRSSFTDNSTHLIMSDNFIQSFEECLKSVSSDVFDSFQSLIYCKVVKEGEKDSSYYCSSIHRVEVQYLDNKSDVITTRFIVKVLPLGAKGDFLNKYGIFEREVYIYEKILPRMIELLTQIKDNNTKLAPNFVTKLSEPTSIVLEDLSFSGFKVPNRKVGLNTEQTLSVLGKMARFHATSIKINEMNPELMEKLKKTSIHEYLNSFSIFFAVGIASLGEVASNWSGFKEIAIKLKNLKSTIIENTLHEYTKSSDGIKVLNHNDLWTNNLMLKYDSNGKIIDSTIIDYQFVYWGSPGIDLNFFMYTSVDNTLRKESWNFLIHHYHKILTSTLRNMEVVTRIPTVADIHNEIIQKGHIAVMASLLKGAVIIAPPDIVDIDVLVADTPEGSSYREMLFSNPNYVEMIKPLLQEFYWMGYLD